MGFRDLKNSKGSGAGGKSGGAKGGGERKAPEVTDLERQVSQSLFNVRGKLTRDVEARQVGEKNTPLAELAVRTVKRVNDKDIVQHFFITIWADHVTAVEEAKAGMWVDVTGRLERSLVKRDESKGGDFFEYKLTVGSQDEEASIEVLTEDEVGKLVGGQG